MDFGGWYRSEHLLNPAGCALKLAGFTLKPAGCALKPAVFIPKPVGCALKPVGFPLKPVGFTPKPAGFIVKPAGCAACSWGSERITRADHKKTTWPQGQRATWAQEVPGLCL